RQHVAVGILEPRNLVTARRGPDPERVLLEESEPLELNASRLKIGNLALDVGHLPAEHRELLRRDGRHPHEPDHDAVGVHHHRKPVLLYALQTEYPFVKRARSVVAY